MASTRFWGVTGWGVTSFSIGIGLLPGIAAAEEVAVVSPDRGLMDREATDPGLTPLESESIAPAPRLPDPATSNPGEANPESSISTTAADLQFDLPLKVTEALSIDPAPAQSKLTPAENPVAQAQSDRSIDPAPAQSNATADALPPKSVSSSTSLLPSSLAPPRLYGELAPTPAIPPTADPFEQWSDAEWMQLLDDEELSEDLPQNPSVPQNPLVAQQPSAATPANPFNFESIDGELLEQADESIGQVTSVSQLADVQPTDWAYQALQSLVERYGVIQGYPDGSFRGDRALTRFEFAAGVNAAMDRVSELVANSSKDAVTQSDLAVLRRLQEDFSTELITLRGRVDGLDARVAELEAQQFSTTVVLNGQVTFGLADAWGGDPPGLGDTNAVFAYLAQLQLAGSFSKNDAFRIDLDAGNFTGGGFADPQALNTQMALLGFQTDTDNQLEMSGAEYRVAVGDRLVLTFKPVGFSLSTVLTPNSLFSSVSQGALSRFAGETPIFKMGSLDAGLGLDWLMTDRLRLQMAYGARNAGNPVQGLFRSDHRAFGVQLLARPASTVTTGIAYVNAFADDGFLDTFTGSTNADTSGGFLEPSAIHAVSGTLQWQIARSVVFGAWGGLTVTDSLESDAVALSTTYQFSLAFPDTFGRQGDLLGVIVGQPLRLRYGLLIEREDEASALHYELFYRIRVNDNIAITPAVFVVTVPGHVANNNTIVVAALRTSFSF